MKYNQDKKDTVNSILNTIKERKIKYCLLQFTNIEGTLKSIGINSNRLEDVIYSGEGFDGSSISGYGKLEESDMVAIPVPETFSIIPWRKNEPDGRFICNIFKPDGTRYEGDPRYILERTISRAKNIGFVMKAAPELEFFLLKKEEKDLRTILKPTDYRGYFSADDAQEDHYIRREIALMAETFPFLSVETVHHEVAHSQHEISMRYAEVLNMADATMTMKMVVKAISANHGYLATFMPKPWAGHNGSGMHVHQSLWDLEGKNVFYNGDDPNKISDTLRYFITGQLKHAHSMTAILNSWPNSYKRLVPGYEAPTLISWGFKNRSMLIRVPNFFDKKNAARCEIRSPDGAGNIYLQLAALLNAGLDGIEYKINPPAPVDLNLFHVSENKLKEMKIDNLPESLGESLSHMKKSSFTRNMLGDIAYQAFSDSKQKENDRYNAQVSEWELNRYSSLL